MARPIDHPAEHKPTRHGRGYPDRSGNLAGDRDEAKALPEDVTARRPDSPDADIHHPAAATATADEEAGAGGELQGGIRPLKPSPKPQDREST